MQGATIRRDEHSGAVVVARIMRGGAADRSGECRNALPAWLRWQPLSKSLSLCSRAPPPQVSCLGCTLLLGVGLNSISFPSPVEILIENTAAAGPLGQSGKASYVGLVKHTAWARWGVPKWGQARHAVPPPAALSSCSY